MNIVIPTLWLSESFPDALASYTRNSEIRNIIVIDNNRNARPDLPLHIMSNPKLKLVEQVENIYVNAAWNLGVDLVKKGSGLVTLLNDDIKVSGEVWTMLNRRDWGEGEVAGVLTHAVENEDMTKLGQEDMVHELVALDYDRNISIGQQYPGFGSMLVFQSAWYEPVPCELRIWFGDDWILRGSKTVLGIRSSTLMIDSHVSMQQMKQSEEFRKVLKSDKQAAQKLLGFEL